MKVKSPQSSLEPGHGDVPNKWTSKKSGYPKSGHLKQGDTSEGDEADKPERQATNRDVSLTWVGLGPADKG